MPYGPSKHHRHSIRLKGYDYSSPGYYFIPSCTQNRICLFGKIINGQMILSSPGNLVKEQWELLPQRFNNIRIDEFVVMPDHFHGILQIISDEKSVESSDIKTVGDIIGAFHSIVTVEYIRMDKMNKWPPFNRRIWQRNYWEHIIRNELALFRIRNFIRNNPKNWDKDNKCGDHGKNVEE